MNEKFERVLIRKSLKKKIKAKLKKIRLRIYNKNFAKPVSVFTVIDFFKIIFFVGLVVLIFYKYLLPK